MTTQTRTRQDILDDIESEIRNIMYADARDGANDYAYVRVHPDGSVYSGREPSYSQTIDEWEGKPPHTVTVWSASGLRDSCGFDSGVFCWEEINTPSDLSGEEISQGYRYGGQDGEDLNEQDGTWYRLTDDLVEEFDLSEILPGIDSQLDDCEWLP